MGEYERRAKALPWVHAIELRPGDPSSSTARFSSVGFGNQRHIEATFPDVRGKKVLELGSWNGKWGFLAEERGAALVVMSDFLCWGRGANCAERLAQLANASWPYGPKAKSCGMREPFDVARAARNS